MVEKGVWRICATCTNDYDRKIPTRHFCSKSCFELFKLERKNPGYIKKYAYAHKNEDKWKLLVQGMEEERRRFEQYQKAMKRQQKKQYLTDEES